ncbi:ABC transporter permease [Hymenobacter pini]|uniref:ABC transporter permease n=1 Tax=Hymenobacter pini TaxID=2880879 RepID=UPI001CF46EE3|nr:ABC transporter permease subunit [Hymenobacter pini]MCA8831559.1 ABC transporter permease subunit [Hymenobacter pini]
MRYYHLFQRHWLATGWLSLVLLAALSAPTAHVVPDLQHVNASSFQPPHWLGTTPQGLDVAKSLWQGARTVVTVSVPAALLTLLLGAGLGGAAGFWGDTRLRVARGPLGVAVLGLLAAIVSIPYSYNMAFSCLCVAVLAVAVGAWQAARSRSTSWALPIDSLVLGLISVLNSVPLLVLVVAVAAVQRPSVAGVVALLSGTCWPTPARLARATTLQINHLTYVEAARSSGISVSRLLWHHIGPNALPVLLVRFPSTVAVLISLETTLSFLGIGLPPHMPSWGRLLAAVRQAPADWWLLLWPGLAVVLTILSLHRLVSSKSA